MASASDLPVFTIDDVATCPECRNEFRLGDAFVIYSDSEMLGEANPIRDVGIRGADIDWDRFPKLASIFKHRPRQNVYWEELARIVAEYGSSEA